jgi:hypothetical protein
MKDNVATLRMIIASNNSWRMVNPDSIFDRVQSSMVVK